MADYSRFKELMERAARIQETIDCYDEKTEKAAAYREIWDILNRHETINWDGVLFHVLDNWPDDNPDEGLAIVKALVKRGASLFDLNREDKSLLQVAVELEEAEPELVEFLLKAGATHDSINLLEVYLQSHKGHKPLLYSKYRIKLIKLLLQAGVPLPEWGNNRITARIIIRKIAKKLALEKRCREMEREIQELKDYIFELEHRPPELGGPEYEAAKQRWQNRK